MLLQVELIRLVVRGLSGSGLYAIHLLRISHVKRLMFIKVREFFYFVDSYFVCELRFVYKANCFFLFPFGHHPRRQTESLQFLIQFWLRRIKGSR